MTFGSNGVRPAGRKHDGHKSETFKVIKEYDRIAEGLPGWRHCTNCEALFFIDKENKCAVYDGDVQHESNVNGTYKETMMPSKNKNNFPRYGNFTNNAQVNFTGPF